MTGPRGSRRLPVTLAALALLSTAVTGLVHAPPAAADVVSPFGQRYDEAVYGDFRTIGNTVMGCPTGPAETAERCAVAASGQGGDNNNTFDMRRLNTAGTTDGFGSSTGRVTVPPGAEVRYARLFWGGNDGTYRGPSGAALKRCDISGADVTDSPGEPLDAVPVIGVDGAPPTKVSAEHLVRDPATTNGPHYYTGEADVTAAFSGVTGTGSPLPVAVGDLWAAGGRGCVAGWSLTVVYAYDAPDPDHAPERRNVYIYGGHVLQRSTSPATTIGVDGFYRAGEGKVRASVTAYEGDWNTPRDRFLIEDRNVVEPHTGNTNNFFVSAADGSADPHYVNNLSIDAKEFEVPDGTIGPGDTSTTLTFATNGDTYVPSALAFSVPVPDLEITKSVSPAGAVAPGDTITYTVRAKNISALDYPNAKFGDDLTDNLDDAVYNGDAEATLGSVSYTAPRLAYLGDIPAGQTATVTYSVTVNDPVTGDGRLRNSVTVESPRSNCDPGSTDPGCSVAPVVEPSGPTPPPSHSPSPPPSHSPDPGHSPTSHPSPAPSPSVTHQHRPAPPAPPAPPAAHGSGSMADTGAARERLWLLGAFALALTAAGGIAFALTRGRRRDS